MCQSGEMSEQNMNRAFKEVCRERLLCTKVTGDLLIAEYPCQCSDLILYTSAFGAKEKERERVRGRQRWRDDMCVDEAREPASSRLK